MFTSLLGSDKIAGRCLSSFITNHQVKVSVNSKLVVLLDTDDDIFAIAGSRQCRSFKLLRKQNT